METNDIEMGFNFNTNKMNNSRRSPIKAACSQRKGAGNQSGVLRTNVKVKSPLMNYLYSSKMREMGRKRRGYESFCARMDALVAKAGPKMSVRPPMTPPMTPVAAVPASPQVPPQEPTVSLEALLEESETIIGKVDDGIVDGLIALMEHFVANAGNVATPLEPPTKFHGKRVPMISLPAYICRLRQYFHCSLECFVLAFIYIDRLVQKKSEVTVCAVTAHRLTLSALVLAAKFQDDVFYTNTFYARVGGLNVSEVNYLELQMLKWSDWKVNVTMQEFEEYRKVLVKAAEGTVCEKIFEGTSEERLLCRQ